jgi:LPS-assembly protein
VFDSALSDFSFSQIFTENIFSGGDRINDADQLTVGLVSKFLEAESGVERFQITAAQRFHFDEELVVINPGDTPRTGNRSDILFGGRRERSIDLGVRIHYYVTVGCWMRLLITITR